MQIETVEVPFTSVHLIYKTVRRLRTSNPSRRWMVWMRSSWVLAT